MSHNQKNRSLTHHITHHQTTMILCRPVCAYINVLNFYLCSILFFFSFSFWLMVCCYCIIMIIIINMITHSSINLSILSIMMQILKYWNILDAVRTCTISMYVCVVFFTFFSPRFCFFFAIPKCGFVWLYYALRGGSLNS